MMESLLVFIGVYEDGSCGKYCWMSLFIFMEAKVTSWMFVSESVEGVFH